MARRKVPTRTPPVARLSDGRLPGLADVTAPWPGRHVDVGGVSIHVRSTPPTSERAEPALFVHGLGGSAHNWTDVAGRLRGRLDIEALDLPGFGRSGPPRAGDYSLRTHARTVIDYLEVAGRGQVHLVGNSMGGAVCILVAAQRPDLIRTLTLISPAVPDVKKARAHPLRSDPRLALLAVPIVGAAALKRMGLLPAEVRARATIKLCFSDASRYPERRMAEAVAEAGERRTVQWADTAMLRSLRGLVRSQFLHGRTAWATMGRIQAPTLVLWGDRDRLVHPDLAPLVAAAIPDSRLLVLPDIGHVAMMEDPSTTARAVLALLEDATAHVDG